MTQPTPMPRSYRQAIDLLAFSIAGCLPTGASADVLSAGPEPEDEPQQHLYTEELTRRVHANLRELYDLPEAAVGNAIEEALFQVHLDIRRSRAVELQEIGAFELKPDGDGWHALRFRADTDLLEPLPRPGGAS